MYFLINCLYNIEQQPKKLWGIQKDNKKQSGELSSDISWYRLDRVFKITVNNMRKPLMER